MNRLVMWMFQYRTEANDVIKQRTEKVDVVMKIPAKKKENRGAFRMGSSSAREHGKRDDDGDARAPPIPFRIRGLSMMDDLDYAEYYERRGLLRACETDHGDVTNRKKATPGTGDIVNGILAVENRANQELKVAAREKTTECSLTEQDPTISFTADAVSVDSSVTFEAADRQGSISSMSTEKTGHKRESDQSGEMTSTVAMSSPALAENVVHLGILRAPSLLRHSGVSEAPNRAVVPGAERIGGKPPRCVTWKDLKDQQVLFTQDSFHDDSYRGGGRQLYRELELFMGDSEVPSTPFFVPNTSAWATAGYVSDDSLSSGTHASTEKGGSSGLAVATEVVSIEGDPLSLPHALAFAPLKSSPFYKNRRFLFYLGMCLLVAGTIGGGLLSWDVLRGNSAPVASPITGAEVIGAPTHPPTTQEESMFWLLFEEIVGKKVRQRGTPHFLAAQWIIFGDPANLEWDASNLIQRFILALFYYQTSSNGDEKWRVCNPSMAENETDQCVHHKTTVLGEAGTLALVGRMNGTRWMSTGHECDWVGISCDHLDVVREIYLPGFGLSGTLPHELAKLIYLQNMLLQFNLFSGTLPSQYASMNHLISMDLAFNGLTGTLPEAYYDYSPSLQDINLDFNFLTGTLSPEIHKLRSVVGIHLAGNFFEGTLPTEIGLLDSLMYLRLEGNFLNGTIPTEIGSLSSMKMLSLHMNAFTGPVPSELGALQQAKEVRLALNYLNDSIPDEVYGITTLELLDFRHLYLSGTLSSFIGNLDSLKHLRLADNQLSGTIPAELTQLSKLETAMLQFNNFTGVVPLSICPSLNETGRSETRRVLQVLKADCLDGFGNTSGNGILFCSCCTSCCSVQKGICHAVEME